MNDERIDLSSVDPSRDAQRWDQLVESVASRAWSARQRRFTVGYQLSAWARPGLAIAAAVALTIWAGALTGTGRDTQAAQNQQEPAFALSEWAANDEVPDTSKILTVLGGSNEAD
jgi:hypothetical protein